jgi:hypothetical protein
MSNGRKGKLVLQEVPSGQAENKVVRLLLQFAKNASVAALRQRVRRMPYTLSNNIEAEKAALMIAAFEKCGATAVFVPHAAAESAADPFERFVPVESEPQFTMGLPAVSRPSANGGTLQAKSPANRVRNLIIFLIFILMLLSFGFLTWQLWPVLGGKIQQLGAFLKQLF